MNNDTQRVPCAHCTLPTLPRADNGPAFCCIGCEAIYHAMHHGGFENFYALQGLAANKPANQGVDRRSESFDYLDQDDFLQTYTEALPDGSRCIDLHLEGVHCAGCVWLTEKMPQSLDGILDSQLSLARGRLSLRWNPQKVALSDAAKWLAQFGYMPHPLNPSGLQQQSSAEYALLKKVGVSWAIAGNIMIMAVAAYGGLNMSQNAQLAGFMRWVSLALATISMAYGGGVFFRRAWASLKGYEGMQSGSRWMRLSMDVPIAAGLAAGWLHSTIATVRSAGDVWFDSIAVLIAALLTARWLQMRGRRFAGDATERLLSLLPSTARRIDDNGVILEIPADKLQSNDLIEIRVGDVIAADGIVEYGQSTLNRAVLTGESRPETVHPGEAVEAGTTNLTGVLHIRVHNAGKNTRMGKLLHWVEQNDRRRAPVVQLADTLGGIFVLVVLLAAALTTLIWWWIDPSAAVPHAVALLVISCPCALGMATPLALTMGVGRAARQGIFVKHDDVLQALAKTTHIIFDKTGTLTEGKITVAHIYGDANAVMDAATLELHSTHPIARALIQWGRANAQTWPPISTADNIQEIAGGGITGQVASRDVLVGHLGWLNAQGVANGNEDWAAIEEEIIRGDRSPLFVAINGTIRAALALGDQIRNDSAALIQTLRQAGITPCMLSGDHPHIVDRYAQMLGLASEQTLGAATPEAKKAFVQELRAQHPHAVIVMVGDGVNDAMAMQEADVGIAVHNGAQAALVAADIFLTQDGVAPIAMLLAGAENVMATVRRNLIGSAIYNAIGITAAAAGLVVPLVAAVAMPFSSLFVIGSSLLQKSFQPTTAPSQAPDSSANRIAHIQSSHAVERG